MSLSGENEIEAHFRQWNSGLIFTLHLHKGVSIVTRSSWLNCALRDDEAVHWVSIGYCEALAIGN